MPTATSGRMENGQSMHNGDGGEDEARVEQRDARVIDQEADLPSEEELEGPDTFYEEMFYNFADDPHDEECTYTYWSDGIGIERTWVGETWQYNAVTAR